MQKQTEWYVGLPSGEELLVNLHTGKIHPAEFNHFEAGWKSGGPVPVCDFQARAWNNKTWMPVHVLKVTEEGKVPKSVHLPLPLLKGGA